MVLGTPSRQVVMSRQLGQSSQPGKFFVIQTLWLAYLGQLTTECHVMSKFPVLKQKLELKSKVNLNKALGGRINERHSKKE